MPRRALLFTFAALLAFNCQAQEKSIYVAVFSDGEKRDLQVEKMARKELKKSKQPVVASPDDATFVMVMWSEYHMGPRTPFYAGPGTVSFEPRLTRLTAVLVAVAAYNTHKGDTEELRKSAVWQGSVFRSGFASDTVGKLIRQYLGTKKS
ncbi:MAG TPA: hypothetical protein VFD58_08945 [Blastocatellia bacterium]|nr:hypothetical protein [Blastocatellia bacterium]